MNFNKSTYCQLCNEKKFSSVRFVSTNQFVFIYQAVRLIMLLFIFASCASFTCI